MSRAARVAKLIKTEVSEIIHEDVSDPRIGFISLTQVDLSPDLENAKIFVSILGDEQKKNETMHGLASATRFIRGKLGDVLEMRDVPKLSFELDTSLERGSKILNIMSKLEKDKYERNISHS